MGVRCKECGGKVRGKRQSEAVRCWVRGEVVAVHICTQNIQTYGGRRG